MKYSDADLLDDINQVAIEVGGTPTLQNYRDHGSHGASTLYDRFGSWQEALEEAGFESREPITEISEEDLLEELIAVADDETPPTVEQMNKEGKYWASTYRSHFGSWFDSLKAAGFAPSEQSRNRQNSVSDALLFDEMARIGEEFSSPPSYQEMEEHGLYSARTYVRRFGSWTNTVQVAGFEYEPPEGKLSKSELIDELNRIEEELGRTPTSSDLREYGDHALSTYQRKFGSWSEAVEAACDDSVL